MGFRQLSVLSVLFMGLFAACSHGAKQPQSGVEDMVEAYDLEDIQQAGEIIAVTISGPDTYFQYHGAEMGLQYLLAQHFAAGIGTRLRMEMAQDTAEMLRMLRENKADIVAYPLGREWIDAHGMAVGVGPSDSALWAVRKSSPMLLKRLQSWYTPQVLAESREAMQEMKARPRVSRQEHVQLLSRSKGVISPYDALFVQHARSLGWDWRLLAAMGWQESAFDPRAVSWAGARGLMQIMPSTAAGMGVGADALFDPSTNVATSAKYIKMLQGQFNDIKNPAERTKFVLAAYNGGPHHVRDAMRLAQKYGRNPQAWGHTGYYILHLSEPKYYRDPVVRHGYMIGSETYHYVNQIMDRWNRYRGIVKKTPAITISNDPVKSRRRNRFSQSGQILDKDEFIKEANED